MQNASKTPPYRVMMLITTPKLAGKASELMTQGHVPMHFRLSALGTAPNEMMDLLGLGDVDKSLLVGLLPKPAADDMLKQFRSALKIGSINSGIGFTLPISSANNLILQLMKELSPAPTQSDQPKEESTMTEPKYAMIAAIVNPGYSEEVMKAARGAGAGGGTVLHSRQIADEATMTAYGLGIQEEKEIVLIVTAKETKLDIMKAITAACGTQSQAQGNVIALPIDTVIGLSDN